MSRASGHPNSERLSFAALRAPHQILIGSGQRAATGWVTAGHGDRAFVCADPQVSSGPDLAGILATLAEHGVAVTVYDDVVPELPAASIAAAVEAARGFGADVVVAVGGGSSIDLGKLVAVLLRHGGTVADYYGENRVPGPTTPVVALPTTAGTGSEVTPVAVLTDPERHSKVGVSSPHLIPVAAICDPDLTRSCPPAVTASAGADAFSHCVEAFTAVRRSADPELARERVFVGRGEITDTLALAGLRHIVAGLPAAYADPDDTDARAAVMYGALLAGLAFGTAGTAAAHALQYPVGTLTGTPHGVGVGLLLPYVMEHNRAAREPELAAIARILRHDTDPAPAASAATDAELAAAAPGLAAGFLTALGIPATLAEIGVPEDRLAWAAEQGTRSARLAENNPVPLTEAAATAILRAAWSGEPSLAHPNQTVGGRP